LTNIPPAAAAVAVAVAVVSIALVIQHAMRMRRIILFPVAFNIKYDFSLQFLPGTFLILRRIQRDISINVHTASSKDFNRTGISSTDFRKIVKYQIS
jgi:hypothetical protein